MADEIERRFRVAGDGWRASVRAATRIRQGYLSDGEDVTVRVRLREGRPATVTIKGPRTGATRAEFEWRIDADEAEGLIALAGDRTVEKTRHEVEAGGHLWEVDVFHGRHAGLVIAEVELVAEDAELALPDWVGEEVTDDPTLYNAALARR